ncbi:hypothetical protein MMC11_002963 [Xylographa trunciseda]|nr:hypothetical protein [Xylographa trunciseda]
MADGGKLSVTNGVVWAMSDPSLRGIPLERPANSRPPFQSQLSNSLPSTPYMGAMKLLDDNRTPPPTVKGTDISSPRSARSESDTSLRPPGKSPFLAGCKYETGMAFSRRRIPYSLGGDKLERASTMPKKYLDPDEEDKLSGDMRELYNRILPSTESEDRRAKFIKKLENILNEQWPGNDINVHVFGSSGNLLCTSDSDVDICITTPMKALERVCLLAKALAEHGMERVVCVPNAKVPIVKIWDPELQLSCDMNVNNTLALENTRMIKTYVQIDWRVRPLAMVVKHWTRERILNDAALGGTLSSYTWICMIINFLQTRNPAILPSLHQRPHQRRVDAQGRISTFADDLDSLRGFGAANKESIGELLFHFFRRYAHEIDFDKHVISIRDGGLISKQAKKWHLMQNNRLCVEEPFNTERNLGNTADDISFRGVHLELRRAFDLLCQAKLDECCEPYEFPPVEERIWSKPAPQPRPVLSRSLSQQGRATKGGGNSRGGHTGQRHRAGVSNRRASSAATTNNIAFKMSLNSQTQSNGQGASGDRTPGPQLHEALIQQMNMLREQEAQLRLQMHQRTQATIHAQYTAQVQPHQIQGSMYPQHLNLDSVTRQRNMFPGPMSAPLGRDPSMSNGASSSKTTQNTGYSSPSMVHTNPSSPSMAPASPAQPPVPEFRRSLHRSTTTDNNFTTLRSHSQPASEMRVNSQSARSIPMPTPSFHLNNSGAMLGYNSLQQLQQLYFRQQQIANMQRNNHQQATMSPRPNPRVSDRRGGDMTPHHPEYVGYYVERSPQADPRDRIGLLNPIPSYHEMTHISRGVSPSFNRLRSHTSRSPSPSGLSSQDRSISFYSAASVASAPPASPPRAMSNNGGSSRHSGPIIIDGSSEISADYTTPPENNTPFYPMVLSEATPLPADQRLCSQMDPISPELFPEIPDLSAPDQYVRNRPVSHVLQFGDFPARHTRRVSPPSTSTRYISTDVDSTLAALQNGSPNHDTPSGLGIDLEDLSINKPNLSSDSISYPTAPMSARLAPKVDVSDLQPNPDHPETLKVMPLLSPVREVRTPSPTATRSLVPESYAKAVHSRTASGISGKDLVPSPLSSVSNGKTRMLEDENTEPKINGVNGNHVTATVESSIPPKGPALENRQSSGWQQSTKKGKKKGKGSVSSLGEILGERKGG